MLLYSVFLLLEGVAQVIQRYLQVIEAIHYARNRAGCFWVLECLSYE
ncbi:MAG: hypothetical protein RQ862_01840 [Candidatus Caldarchaeales archaeon]|nr:hypothetical protein [Candidatus Caldarchaeales archaeon]